MRKSIPHLREEILTLIQDQKREQKNVIYYDRQLKKVLKINYSPPYDLPPGVTPVRIRNLKTKYWDHIRKLREINKNLNQLKTVLKKKLDQYQPPTLFN